MDPADRQGGQTSLPGVSRLRWMAVIALVAAPLALAACGDSGASQDEIKEARRQGAARAQQQAKIHAIQKELRELRRDGKAPSGDSTQPDSVAPAPEGGSAGSSGNCGGGVSAGAYTTCGFAENVESDYYATIAPGAGSVYSYSPTTGRGYEMYCSAGSPHTCTGGNEASVSFP